MSSTARKVSGINGGGARQGGAYSFASTWSPFVLLACAVVFGGGVWGIGDVLLSLLGLLLLAWGWFAQACGAARRWGLLEWGTLAGFLGLVLVYALPLPGAMLAGLPGREQVASDLAAAGADGSWRWLSLDASGSWRNLAALLPAVAMLVVSIRGLSDLIAIRLCVWLVVLGCASVLLGIAQVGGGAQSPLRLHDFHNLTGGLGFFSYRNLQATHLLMVLPVAVALLLETHAPARSGLSPFGRAIAMLAVPLLLLGVALTFSRAGMVLGAFALGGCVLLYGTWPDRTRRWAAEVALLTALVAGISLIAWFALPGLLGRLSENPLEDGRWPLYRDIAARAQSFQPTGAGLGSFEQVYQAAPNNVALVGAYMNQAHNDWLQLWLELGWLSVPLALGVTAVLARATWRVWRHPHPQDLSSQTMLARAASISLLIALVHSFFDYPLRTGANLIVFSMMAALVLRAGFRARHQYTRHTLSGRSTNQLSGEQVA